MVDHSKPEDDPANTTAYKDGVIGCGCMLITLAVVAILLGVAYVLFGLGHHLMTR
jgi:hypothetical protein